MTSSGETWARDVGLLHDYLENHFPEIRFSFSHFRDITGRVAEAHVKRRMGAESPTLRIPTARDLGLLQATIEEARASEASHENLAGLVSEGGILGEYLRSSGRAIQARIERRKEELDRARQDVQIFEELQRQYLRKGSAAALTFHLCSSPHVTSSAREFEDAVASVVKELDDADRYEVRQKLGQGRLNIQVAPAEEPTWTWIEEWLGGSLSPRQLQTLVDQLPVVCDHGQQHLMVTPDEDIVLNGHIKEDQKLLGARVLGSLLRRVDQPQEREIVQEFKAIDLPANVGRSVTSNRLDGRCLLPLAKLQHVAVSGSTGAGKSVFVRVLTEEAARLQRNVLVLDPRNQAAGLLVPEDRPELLSLYSSFPAVAQAPRAFPFRYFAPGEHTIPPLASSLGGLAQGLNIVSFKELEEEQRCSLFAEILDEVFSACAQEESAELRLLVVVEEAQLFTRRRVSQKSKEAGSRAENALDRVIREGRKYGLCVVIASQSIRDFSHEVASIRQNTNTKVFFRNADREVDYAADFLEDGREIIDLPPGTCILHNAALGCMRIRIRPPYSKLWEFSSADTRKLLRPESRQAAASPDAQRLINILMAETDRTKAGLNLSELGTRAGVTSKRRLQDLVDELEGAGFVRTRKLRERGQPRVVELIRPSSTDQTPDATRTEGDANA